MISKDELYIKVLEQLISGSGVNSLVSLAIMAKMADEQLLRKMLAAICVPSETTIEQMALKAQLQSMYDGTQYSFIQCAKYCRDNNQAITLREAAAMATALLDIKLDLAGNRIHKKV
ncbi:MAG TPA: hypothetical protein VI911_02430 [Patescibacteria group bacterium]|nr:hypothetical protein [Patescibacteria group bacterium]